ncbi:hypothetical protein [Falsiroseomonas sp. HW251]|uniref:hypothetical protein n=1 Tax=Falsiroseomonas sp. HW251 TaxID=3390998 RepID=UPI003D31C372
MSPLFCYDNYSRWVCPETGERIRRPDLATGAPLADLFRIRRIIVERSPGLAGTAAAMGLPWREVAASDHALFFERPLPNASLPGSLSWPVVGLRAEAAGPATARREALRLSERDPAVTSLIFARAYWPGYAATLDGAPLPVRAHEGVFVAVDLPRGVASGELTLIFTPAGLREGLFLSGIAIVVAMTHLLLLHGAQVRRRPRPL